jgi:SAM-dependent methyltransferase
MHTPTRKTEATPFDDGDLYDLQCEGLEYGLDYYLDLARRAGGPVLDLCCGTGRVMLPCLAAGIDVEGVDLSPQLLAKLQEKAAKRGLRARTHEANMASFRLGRTFALVMIPFNAFVHNLTTHDQVATLVCCREHLRPGGLLAFDGFFPGPAIVNAPDNVRALEGELTHPETGLPVRCFDTHTFDRVEQLMGSFNEIEFLDAAGNVTSTRRSRTALRWIYKHEMALLLRVAGFARWQIYGGFDRRPLAKETDGMVVEAWNGPLSSEPEA